MSEKNIHTAFYCCLSQPITTRNKFKLCGKQRSIKVPEDIFFIMLKFDLVFLSKLRQEWNKFMEIT